MKHGIIIFILLASAVTAALAQPKGEIYYTNETGNRSDTIDFDIVFYKNTTPVIRWVTLDNSGTSNLQIAENKAPHFVVLRINPATLEYTEFNSYLMGFPFQVNSSQRKSFTISYIPQNDISPSQYPLGNRVALLKLALSLPSDTTLVAKHDFLLTVLKTKDFLASRREILDFDSVYVGVPLPIQREWLVKNTTEFNVSVTKQNFTPLVTRFNKEFFPPAKIDSFTFVGLSSKPFPIQFRPLELGLDSAQYSIIYSPNIDNQTDSATVKLRGIGVQQIIDIDNQTSATPGNAQIVTSNIVSIANNARVDDSIIISLVIRNNGNIPFGLISQHLAGDTAYFYILKKFRDDHDLRPKSANKSGELDTAIIVFKPKEPGNFSVNYLLGSDIRSRIVTAPDSAKQHKMTIIASAAKPTLVLLNAPNSTIDFDSLYLPIDKSCASPSKTITLQMKNSGNAPLKVNSAIIRPIGVFTTSIPDAEIPANQQRNLNVTFTAPADTGNFTAELLIATNSGVSNEPNDTVRIHLRGKSVQPPVVSLSFPERTTSRAGRQISIPLLTSKTISSVGNMELSVIIQDTLGLEFIRLNSLGTASEGATIKSPILNGNTLKFTITAPDRNFYERDTLAYLIFNTYLSRLTSSSLVVGAKAGTQSCSEVFPVELKNGIFVLDSLCGKAFQVILGAGTPFQLHSIAPNPSDEIAWIEYSLPYTTTASVKMYTSFGTEVGTIADGTIESGTYQAAISVGGLSPGVYYCVMQSGLFTAVQTIVVAR